MRVIDGNATSATTHRPQLLPLGQVVIVGNATSATTYRPQLLPRGQMMFRVRSPEEPHSVGGSYDWQTAFVGPLPNGSRCHRRIGQFGDIGTGH